MRTRSRPRGRSGCRRPGACQGCRRPDVGLRHRVRIGPADAGRRQAGRCRVSGRLAQTANTALERLGVVVGQVFVVQGAAGGVGCSARGRPRRWRHRHREPRPLAALGSSPWSTARVRWSAFRRGTGRRWRGSGRRGPWRPVDRGPLWCTTTADRADRRHVAGPAVGWRGASGDRSAARLEELLGSHGAGDEQLCCGSPTL
jgi:hypothetical protein